MSADAARVADRSARRPGTDADLRQRSALIRQARRERRERTGQLRAGHLARAIERTSG